MRKMLWITIVVVVIVGGGWWYSSVHGERTVSDPFLRTAVATRGNLVVSISATGRIEPIKKVEVKSKASGEIIELPIEAGDYVHRGDLIVRLDPVTARNDFDQATADHEVARVTVEQRKKELDRQQSLFTAGLTSESAVDDAKLAYEEANAQLVRAQAAMSTARERLDDTEIRAPIDGVVLSRAVEMGQIISSGMTTVTGGTPLCTIADLSQVYVVADVDETDIGKVNVGQVASINADAYPDLRIEGRVLRIAPLAKEEQNVTMFEVTALVDNADGLLKAGMNATVEVILARADSVVLLPSRAIEMKPAPAQVAVTDSGSGTADRELAATQRGRRKRGGNGMRRGSARARMVPSVQVRRNGVMQWTPVRTGLSNLDNTEILSGVAEGDTIIYNLSSGVMRSREAFRQRMRGMSSVSGMRSKK